MTDYPYDPDLPYVAVAHGGAQARFRTCRDAEVFLDGLLISGFVIDTTPEPPRVPADAKFITYLDRDGYRYYAESYEGKWVSDTGNPYLYPLEVLPGVTLDTVFTVLDERKN